MDVITASSLKGVVDGLATKSICKAMRLAKKGKLKPGNGELELNFISMILPYVDRVNAFNIACYIESKY